MNFFKKYGFIIFIVFLIISLFNPIIANVAIICMIGPIIMAALGKGRYWCGNFCPRGSFFDNILKKVSTKKSTPKFLKSPVFRLFMILLIFVMFFTGIIKNLGNASNIGMVFYRIIAITSLVAIFLGLFFSHRSWCTFCPMGTLSSLITLIKGKKLILKVDKSCLNCGICSKNCPMELNPSYYKNSYITDKDCIYCNECVNNCPKKLIKLNKN